MLQFRFTSVEENLTQPDIGPYRSHGSCAEQKTPAGWEKVLFISDVSCNGALVTRLAALCTELQLEPCHLMNVVLDAIS